MTHTGGPGPRVAATSGDGLAAAQLAQGGSPDTHAAIAVLVEV